jgi:aspartate racemase
MSLKFMRCPKKASHTFFRGKKMKKLGVIGGLGPLATAYFYELITNMTDVSCDQDHIEIIIDSKPGIPDRTGFIIGKSDKSPLPQMIEAGKLLESCGAQVIAIPCITAHYFHEDLVNNINVPIINLIEETVGYLKDAGCKNVGIMATDGTVQSGLFQKELARQGMGSVVPDAKHQADVMHLIYENVKLGRPVDMDRFFGVKTTLREAGADVIILGCTELSVIKADYKVGAGFIDGLEVLARKSVNMCEAPLKSEYNDLITK